MKKSIIFATLAFVAFAAGVNAQSYVYNNDLRLGSTGPDVVNLQTWLIANGFDIPSIASGAAGKGYFGLQTQAAVAAYQRGVGLPAYGFFGPMTRAILNAGNDSRGSSLRVTAPNGGETWKRGTTQYITWSGVSGVLNQTADIRLEFAVPACAEPGQPIRCMIMVRAPLTIATNVNLNAGSFAWNVGTYAVPACLSGYVCDPVNISDGQYKIQICPTNNSSAQCDESDNYFNITSGTVNSQAPVINGIDAPTSLTINQTGTWTVHATDPLNGVLSYLVDWGDSNILPPGMVGNATNNQFVQSTTFAHSYANAGTYTVRFTVRNANGFTNQTSSSVTVTNPNNTAGPLRIVSPNGGEVWQRGTTQTITWTSPYYFVAAYADLKITQKYNCTTQVCPAIAYAPYTIATNIPINQNSYNWNVGTATNYSGSIQTIPDGQYTIQLCQSGTSVCDQSDDTFTITSIAYGNTSSVQCPIGYTCTPNYTGYGVPFVR